MFEALESRRLFSVSLNATTHVLTINGTSGNDVIAAKVVNGTTLQVSALGASYAFATSKVTKIVINDGDGSDKVTLDASVKIPATIYTGPGGAPDVEIFGDVIQSGSGNDTIYQQGSADRIDGGAGNDKIYVQGSGQSTLKGGAGNDQFVIPAASVRGDNQIDGGSGNDTADYSGVGSNVLLQNGGAGFYFFQGGVPLLDSFDGANNLAGFEAFWGGSGNDYIYGDGNANSLKGNGGDDYLSGGGGNDYLNGGSGHDALYGGDGNDYLDSRDGTSDFLSGGKGTDSARKDPLDTSTGIETIIP
jgi:Ca2+-binding RTX toxin-like protein